MDHVPPAPSLPDPGHPRPGAPPPAGRARAGDAATGEGGDEAPLGELLVAMRSESAAVREAAWAACYRRYHRVVWTRALHVMRSIAWLQEPHEMAADVASDVFVGLPDAVRNYREEGRAEWWLKQVVVRTALRKKEALTGRWASGRRAERAAGGPASARRFVSFDESPDEIVAGLDSAEREELLELERRRAALRDSPDETRRRWAEFIDLYVAGHSFEGIGERMGLTEQTARNWLWKIRKHLARPPGAE
jgi:RNA polymerase sigma factor (sigma-70 family)